MVPRSWIASGAFFLLATQAFGQNTSTANSQSGDKAAAYYNYALGHLYAELAAQYNNRSEYFNKAVDSYRAALKADPGASFIAEELSDLYIQSGRLREAVTDAEDTLKQHPDDLNARRLLARIYTRLIGDPQQNRIDQTMVKKAIEQYSEITKKEPKDVESWLMLGRLQRVAQSSTEAINDYKKVLELDPNNTDAMTGLALVYGELGDTKAAADLLKKAAEKDPNPRSLAALAETYEQMKDYGLAAETLRRALDLQPGNAELQHALAEDLLRANQLDDALKLYSDMVADDPKDAQSFLRISMIYREKHDFAKAHEALAKAKQINPDDLEVQFNEVILLDAEGKTGDAIQSLKAILDTNAKSRYAPPERAQRVELLDRLGFLYNKNEQYAQAVDTFRQIGELDPDKATTAEAQIIETYVAAKDFQKAEAEADAASKKFPNDRTIRVAHASLLAEIGKTDQAASEVKKLLNGKDDRETYVQLASIYEKGKNWTEMGKALDAAEKLSTAKEEQENIHFMRGAMYERMKNYPASEAEFRKVLEINPQNSSTLNYLGYMLADRNVRLQEAEDLIKKAVDLEPKNGAYLDSLGWVFFRENKLSDAEEKLQQALESMSKDPTVHEHLGDVYFQEGKIREAIAQWQNSLKAMQSGSPAEQDRSEVSKLQKKLDDARVRLARETGAKQ